MTRRTLAACAALMLVLSACACAAYLAAFLYRSVGPEEPVTITLRPGTTLSGAASLLEREGIVTSALSFRLLARVRGAERSLHAGEYLFDRESTPGQVLERLVTGDVKRFRITIPEGLALREIAALLEQQPLADPQQFLALAFDPDFVKDQDIEADSLEGYLFPETYTLSTGDSADVLISAMLRQFHRRLSPDMVAAAGKYKLSIHQLVTLASIIQKEAGNIEEMPLISAVFHNRLRRGMPLQADPTVIYGIDNFDGNLTRKHLETPTPYNTYRMRGLPAGPITNPGADALAAAAFPAQVDFLYFVARGDGTHAFSATLREHNAAVRRFQLKR